MKDLFFEYSMQLSYSEYVNPGYFTIKCIPRNTQRQELVKLDISMDPKAKYSYSEDGFGNKKIIGTVREDHNHYYLGVSGQVKIKQVMYEELCDETTTGVYRYPCGKTIPSKGIKNYATELSTDMSNRKIRNMYDKAIFVMHRLQKDFEYNTRTTDISTTAEQAWKIGSGVCQDYAHIFISIMRLLGVPARYVTGLMIGEGKSHAWVELMLGNKWIGFDPTNALLVDDNYVKLAHGRDAGDCKINLGIIHGGGTQEQEVKVKVWKE